MGGTFNPVHNGHLILAEYAREIFSLDEIVFMPSRQPAYKEKSAILPDAERFKLLSLAIEGNPYFSVSDMELRRQGNTYTADTVLELRQTQPEHSFSLILGGDSLLSLKRWYRPEVILSCVRILAAARPGSPLEQIKEKASELTEQYRADIEVFEIPQIDISSSDIRKRLAQGHSVRYLVPEKVNEYLKKLTFYTGEKNWK